MISAARLAGLQLRRQKIRLLVALAGVAFAVILMSMQIGFKDALFRSAVVVHRRLEADVVMVNPHYNIVAFPIAISRRRLYQALSFPGVRSVASVYTGIAKWRNPDTGRQRDVFVIGVDPAIETFDIPAVNAARETLRRPDVVLFDELSRPEFGPIAARTRAGESVTTEASGRRITVGGLFALGTSFGIDATIVTSETTYLRMFPFRTPGTISIGLIRVAPGVDPATVRDRLRAALPRDVVVLTKTEFMDREVHYWSTATPIGYVFNFGVLMGVVVGAIIVYQILFADIADHLSEYATLKAMGYANRYLAVLVLVEALILGVAGYVPGLVVSWWLYGVTSAATRLPMAITPGRAALVLGNTVVMCWVSGLLAMRKLRSADPAEVF